MSKVSAFVATITSALLLFAAAIPAQTQTRPETQQSLSKVRIVRLSEVRGAVQLDRGIGNGLEPAILNMPVVDQNRLQTEMGVAEVEFEDDSTIRLGPYSEVEFLLLGRTAQGATVSTVRLVKGMAYVSLVKASGKGPNVFDLLFGDRNISLQPDTHLRLAINGEQAKLAVLHGNVQVQGHGSVQAIDISRKHTATFALADNTLPMVAKGIESESLFDHKTESLLDEWDKQLDQYHAKKASITRFGGVPYSYGVSDMLYYGAFENAGGCGMMWRPYFASTAWDPFANGTWAYYSGAGYSWVSPYPWGWTPYHYGSWSFCPGTGWGWMPGGSWMGIRNISSAVPVRSANGIKLRHPPMAPQSPRVGRTSLVPVNKTSLVHSGIDSQGSFVFRKDSAGLGVPRKVLGNLRGISSRTARTGMATMPLRMRPEMGVQNGMRGARNGHGPAGINRGREPLNSGYSNVRPSGNLGRTSNGPRGMSAPMRSAPSMGPSPSMHSAPSMRAPSPSGGGRAH